jgi:hypothetical protein
MKLQRAKATARIAAGFASATLALLMTCSSGISQTKPQPTSGATRAVHVCQFRPVDGTWKGSCGRLGGQNPTLTIAPAKTITTGVWRKGDNPTTVWAGDITYSDDKDQIEIEIYAGGSGVLRNSDGWFPVSKFALSANTLECQIDFAREVLPSDLDRQIVQRAVVILSSESVWNRADTRACAATDTKWSIYCAMQRATVEVTGAFHHRRPALQLVRTIVEERSVGRPYTHRLMDYNNDPSTRLEDVRTLFAEALARIGR